MKPALILTVLIAFSCSPQARLKRLIEKHPELARTDTITVHDTIYTPADTVHATRWLTARDTITIENERQVVRVVRIPTGSPCDTARFLADIEGIVKPDTIYWTKEVPVEKVVPCPPGSVPWWCWVVISALVVFLFLSLRRK